GSSRRATPTASSSLKATRKRAGRPSRASGYRWIPPPPGRPSAKWAVPAPPAGRRSRPEPRSARAAASAWAPSPRPVPNATSHSMPPAKPAPTVDGGHQETPEPAPGTTSGLVGQRVLEAVRMGPVGGDGDAHAAGQAGELAGARVGHDRDLELLSP